MRVESVELALKKMLLPDLVKELRSHLLAEAKECVLKACCRKLYNWIKVCLVVDYFYCISLLLVSIMYTVVLCLMYFINMLDVCK